MFGNCIHGVFNNYIHNYLYFINNIYDFGFNAYMYEFINSKLIQNCD